MNRNVTEMGIQERNLVKNNIKVIKKTIIPVLQ
jgi:hypothetical protein